jgi:hypothetical protein
VTVGVVVEVVVVVVVVFVTLTDVVELGVLVEELVVFDEDDGFEASDVVLATELV